MKYFSLYLGEKQSNCAFIINEYENYNWKIELYIMLFNPTKLETLSLMVFQTPENRLKIHFVVVPPSLGNFLPDKVTTHKSPQHLPPN